MMVVTHQTTRRLNVLLPVLFTPLRQSLHDRAAGVIVVNHDLEPERWGRARRFFGAAPRWVTTRCRDPPRTL
jgi:uncharacterized RDD family membrane protein YckC